MIFTLLVAGCCRDTTVFDIASGRLLHRYQGLAGLGMIGKQVVGRFLESRLLHMRQTIGRLINYHQIHEVTLIQICKCWQHNFFGCDSASAEQEDPFKVLGVSSGSTDAEVKRAYYKLSLKLRE